MSIIQPGKKLAICSDHAGYELKSIVEGYLLSQGIESEDFGCYSEESCDYADFAHPCALAIEEGRDYPGIGICGSGNGISMTLNKHQGIRAAICWTVELARLARAHNDANVLVLPHVSSSRHSRSPSSTPSSTLPLTEDATNAASPRCP